MVELDPGERAPMTPNDPSEMLGLTDDPPVLLVDDEQDILRALKRTLTSYGFGVLTADRPSEALKLASLYQPAVTVSDFRMPEMDGVTLLSRLREEHPNMERVLLTAYADLEAVERGVNDAGVHRVLHKPCPIGTLVSVVHESMRRARVRRERDLLLDQLRQRNEELAYLNSRLTEQVTADGAALHTFRRRWDAALDAISDPVAIVNETHRIEGVNAAFENLTGLPLRELEGHFCYTVLCGNAAPCSGCPIATGFGRIDREHAGSPRVYEARAYPLPGESRAHLCIYQDTTERAAIERQANELEKMAAIGRLAGGVAHEVNNPLQAILSFVQLAQRPQVPPDKMERYLEVIREAALRCRDIVQSLRSFSRREPIGERSEVDLTALCAKTIQLFRSVIDRDIAWEPLSAERILCFGNANQLHQVLVNLIQNAVDATAKGGHVRIAAYRDDGDAMIIVEDDGPGVPDHDRVKIFEPFFTTKPEGVGTGLGLSISSRIVQGHGGRLTVGTSPLGGARFEVRVPRGDTQGGANAASKL